MVNCPRCAQPVDEMVRNRCPLCFTAIPQSTVQTTPDGLLNRGIPTGLSGLPDPSLFSNELMAVAPAFNPQSALPSAQAPAALQILAPGARLSLAGDVIDSNDPPNAVPNYIAGAPTHVSINSAHPDVHERKRRMERTLPGEEGTIQRSGGMVGTVMALVVFLGAAVGLLYFWMHRTNPKDQAILIVKAFASKDWRASYDLVSLKETGKKQCPDPEALGKQAEKLFNAFEANPKTKPIYDNLSQAADNMTAGEPVITGDKAEVMTAIPVKTESDSVTVRGKARLINEGGVWKLDMTSESQSVRDATIRDLIGKPDTPGFGG